MSRAASGTPPVDVSAKIGDVLGTIATLPAAVHGAFRERIFDLLSHHRLTVLKHHGLPAGRSAQKWLATRMYRFTRSEASAARIVQLYGEGFASPMGRQADPAPIDLLETGGTVSSNEPMAIPVGAGRGRFGGGLRTHSRFQQMFKARQFDITPSGALVTTATGGGKGLRSVLWGVLRRTRRQPPQLGYMRRFEDVQQRHLGRLEGDLERAMTAAGREGLIAAAQERNARRGMYADTRTKWLEQHPGQHKEARRVAAAAAKAARQAGLTRENERA